MQMLKSKAMIDKPPTAAKCDVKVKAYGNKPSRFPKATNKNTVKMNEKYFRPSMPTFSFRRDDINSYTVSGTDWATDGMIVLLRKQSPKMRVDKTTANTIKRLELVKEMSTPPTSSGIIGLIVNCSIGLDTTNLLLISVFVFYKTIYV